MPDIIWIILLIVLILLSSTSDLFGKNIPRFLWWIALISAGLIGFVTGFLLAPFPENLLIGALISIGSVLSFFMSRAIRSKHRN